MLKTTAGRLIVGNALPPDMQEWAERTFDKKTLTAFFSELAQKHPDQYRDVSHKLLQIARKGTLESGSNSFGLEHIRVSPVALKRRKELDATLAKIDDDDSLADSQRRDKMILAIAKAKEGFNEEL